MLPEELGSQAYGDWCVAVLAVPGVLLTPSLRALAGHYNLGVVQSVPHYSATLVSGS